MCPKPLSTLMILVLVLGLCLAPLSSAGTETFVFGGCSKNKYYPGTPYESAVNSILTSFINSAMFSSYNNFTVPATATSSSNGDTVSGVFQCRGDLGSDACARCVARAVSQLGVLCLDACGGAIQLEGCFVKYDNATFLGIVDKTVVVDKCGPPSAGYGSDGVARVDAVMEYLVSGGGGGAAAGSYRVAGSGSVQGVAQCVGDLSAAGCKDCVAEAAERLRTQCGPSAWGDVYLAKCYARFSEGGFHSRAPGKGKITIVLLLLVDSVLILITSAGAAAAAVWW